MTHNSCNHCQRPIPDGEDGHYFSLKVRYSREDEDARDNPCGVRLCSLFKAGSPLVPSPSLHLCRACLVKLLQSEDGK